MEFITTLFSLIWTLLFTKEAFWLTIGLLLGWNILPQPSWIKNVVNKILKR